MGSSYSAPVKKDAVFPALVATLPSMKGKTVAITGCTSGTGLILACVCIKLGADVLMLNRKSERAAVAEQHVRDFVKDAKETAGVVTTIECDLADFDSVREAAAKVKEVCADKGLDVLCNNAGVMALADIATKQGYDIQMQTNHLSHFLLVKQLFPLLEQAAEARGEARVVNHSSIARKGGPLEPKYLEKTGGNLGGNSSGMAMNGPRWKRYQQTKLANLVFTLALADRSKARSSKVKVLCAHPGVAATELQTTTVKDGGMGSGFAKVLMGSASQSPADGACGIIICSCAVDVKNREFYGPKGTGLTGPAVLIPLEPKEDAQEQKDLLWSKSCEAVGDIFTSEAPPSSEQIKAVSE